MFYWSFKGKNFILLCIAHDMIIFTIIVYDVINELVFNSRGMNGFNMNVFFCKGSIAFFISIIH